MTQRIVENAFDLKLLISFLEKQDLPFTVNVSSGGRRSVAQNRLIHLWMNEIHDQMPGTFESVEYVRGYCKLHFGVPILRNADEKFRAEYDRVVRPRDYPEKIAFMMEPIALPVTSRMNVKQLSEYLDAMHLHFASEGVELTIPPDKHLGWTPPVEAYEDVQ